jgi:hypothetical protein
VVWKAVFTCDEVQGTEEANDKYSGDMILGVVTFYGPNS